MAIPNVGVTQVIQDPGLGGTLARGLGGITQMLMAQQEQARLQEAEAYRRKMQEAQLKLQQDAADAKLRGEQQIGQGLTSLMTPQNVSVDVGAATGIPQTATGQMHPAVEAVMAKMDPQFRAQFMESAQPIVQDRKAKAEQAKQERAYDEAVRDLPEGLRGPMRMAMRMSVNKLAPSEVISDIYRRSLGASNVTPEQLKAMRAKYPEFAELPDDDLVDAVGRVAELQVKSRLGVLYKPNSGGGGGGGTPTGMTPQQKQRLASLEKTISTARIELGRYNKRSPAASDVQTIGSMRRPITPLDPQAANRHVADSTGAYKRYQDAIAAKQKLQNEIDGVPDGALPSVPELASMVNEALRAIRVSDMPPDMKEQKIQEALAEYKRLAVQSLGG